MSTENFGRNLTIALKVKGWSQSELARRSGVSQSNISSICKGSNEPKLSTALAICEALGLELKELLDDEQEADCVAA